MALGQASIMAFAPSTDLDRARAFYGEVLGLAVQEVDDFACVLRGAGTTLRVTKVARLSPQPFTVLGWEVDDIDAIAGELVSRGVEFLRPEGLAQDEVGIWTAPGGTRVAWFHDPDGNMLSISQR